MRRTDKPHDHLARPRLIVDSTMVLYIGMVDVVPEHRCGVTVFGAGIDGPVRVQCGDRISEGRLFMMAPGIIRSVTAFTSRLGVLLIDPGVQVTDTIAPPRTLASLTRLAACPDPAAWRDLKASLALGPRTATLPTAVQQAARLIDVSEHHAMIASEIATCVGLSTSRLEHLFSESMGTPMGAYRTWRRFRGIASAIANGANLTEAAHQSGFYDSAHFTRSFKAAFGLSPSMIFQPDLRIDLLQ